MNLYLIHAVGSDFYKIGYAVNVKRRMAALQTGCPYILKLLSSREGTMANELALQNHFKQFHFRGEWFCFGSPIQAQHYFGTWEPKRNRKVVYELDATVRARVESAHGNVRA